MERIYPEAALCLRHFGWLLGVSAPAVAAHTLVPALYVADRKAYEGALRSRWTRDHVLPGPGDEPRHGGQCRLRRADGYPRGKKGVRQSVRDPFVTLTTP